MFDNSSVKDTKATIKPAERVEGCFLESIEFIDKKFLDFIFVEKKTGATLRQREFEPSIKDGNAENLKKSIDSLISRVTHILRCYISEEKALGIKGSTWDAYCVSVKNSVKDIDIKNIECALKVVYNKQYSALPRFPNFISTTKRPCSFETNPAYDKYTIEAQPDKENIANFPSSDFPDDLPQDIVKTDF